MLSKRVRSVIADIFSDALSYMEPEERDAALQRYVADPIEDPQMARWCTDAVVMVNAESLGLDYLSTQRGVDRWNAVTQAILPNRLYASYVNASFVAIRQL